MMSFKWWRTKQLAYEDTTFEDFSGKSVFDFVSSSIKSEQKQEQNWKKKKESQLIFPGDHYSSVSGYYEFNTKSYVERGIDLFSFMFLKSQEQNDNQIDNEIERNEQYFQSNPSLFYKAYTLYDFVSSNIKYITNSKSSIPIASNMFISGKVNFDDDSLMRSLLE